MLGEVALASDDQQRIARATLPAYPEKARTAFVEGKVRIDVVIQPSGDVSAATPSKDIVLLRDAAIGAARRWRFDARATATRATITFVFYLVAPDAPEADVWPTYEPPLTVRIPARRFVLNTAVGRTGQSAPAR